MRLHRFYIAAVCALLAGIGIRVAIQKFSVFGSLAGNTEALKEPVPAYLRSLHPKYPYSIIPGGAYSPSELQRADMEDDLVKAHYADFDVKKADMVKLTDDRFQYVSYRKQNKVYWTKKKLRIPKGELLLTDGTSWARARCGNRLSDTPRTPVSESEPPATELAAPPVQPGMPMELAETTTYGPLSSVVPVERFPAVVPPDSVTPPPELPPLTPNPPLGPAYPATFIPPVVTPTPPGGGSPTPVVPPTNNPPVVVPPGNPPEIPPPGNPPVSAVPEPQAVYLFLVTFVVSLYCLTRMMPPEKSQESNEDAG